MSDNITKHRIKLKIENDVLRDDLFSDESEVANIICPVCHSLLTSPHQLDCCGTRICGSCSTKLNESFKCPDKECGKSHCRVHPDRAHEKDLDKLLMNCPFCDKVKSISFPKLVSHIETHRLLKCEFCKEMFIFEKQKDKHERDECEHRKVQCVLHGFGCNKLIPYNKLGDHNSTGKHQKAIMNFIKQARRFLNSGKVKSTMRRINELDRQHYNEIFSKLGLLVAEAEAMIRNCSDLDSQKQAMMTKITEARTKFEQVKELFSNSAKLLEQLYQILVTMQESLDEIKSKLSKGFNMLSPDATFTLKININSIKDGQTISSGPIHTSTSGYVVEIVHQLYTDRHKKSYLSISILLLKGDFDAILMWPVIYPITISILDLTSSKNHISQLVDSRKAVFNRPMEDSNTIHQMQQFCAMDHLQEKKTSYIQEDCVFTQVKFDFTAPGTNTISDKAIQKPIEDYINRNIVEEIA